MKPPALARVIVRLFSDSADRAFLVEDLADRFHEVARTEGLRAARRWYWLQAISVIRWALRPDSDWIRWRSVAGVVGDARLGVRALTRRPLYAVGVAGTLGLGLAAAMLTFVVAWKVWLTPMPYRDPDGVVRLYEIEPASPANAASQGSTDSRRQRLSAGLLEDFRAHNWRTIDAVSAAFIGLPYDWRRDGDTRSVTRVRLSRDGFGILGIVPTLGRLPVEAETEVLLSEEFWRTNFGAASDVVGSEMILGDQARRVVGVARVPSGFPGDADMVDIIEWEDAAEAEEWWRGLRYVDVIARIRRGRSVAEAKAEVNAFVVALAEIHPQHRGWSMDVVVLADDLMRAFRGVLALLLAAGTTFLMLAAVNVMGLVAARRVEGRQDRSIRLALGASEGRLLRGSLVESLMLAGVGSVAGVATAYGLIGPIRAMVPHDVPRLGDVAVSAPLALGGLSVGITLGMFIGVAGYLVSRGAKPSVGRVPAWRAVGAGGRRALVIGQVVLTTLLVAGGVAILYRVSTLRAVDLGFEPEGVFTATPIHGPNRSGSQEWVDAWQAILDGLHARGIPAAAVWNRPLSGDEVPPIGIKADAVSEEIYYEIHAVSEDYFSVMGIEMLAGRAFGSADYASSMMVAIVSEELVDQYFPPGTPVERVIGRVIPGGPSLSSRTVVGVVESTRHHGPDAPVMPDLYTPSWQWTFAPRTLVVRGEPARVAHAVSDVMTQVDPDLRWRPLMPFTSHLKEWFAPLRLQLFMIGVLGTLGLMLASLGLYALMAYQVATRRKEFGIRKAAGATDGRLVWGVLAGGVTMALIGAVIGLGAWYQLLPWTRGLVEGIDSAGYLVPLSTALVVGGSCVLATLVPAARAARVDPVVTLKAE